MMIAGADQMDPRRRAKLVMLGLMLCSFTLLYDRRHGSLRRRQGFAAARLRGGGPTPTAGASPRSAMAPSPSPAAVPQPGAEPATKPAAGIATSPGGGQGAGRRDGPRAAAVASAVSTMPSVANATAFPANVSGNFEGLWSRVASAAPLLRRLSQNASADIKLAHAVAPEDTKEAPFPLTRSSGSFSLRVRDSPLRRGLDGLSAIKGRLMMRAEGEYTMAVPVEGLYLPSMGQMTLIAHTTGDLSLLVVPRRRHPAKKQNRADATAVPESGSATGMDVQARPATPATTAAVATAAVSENVTSEDAGSVAAWANGTKSFRRRTLSFMVAALAEELLAPLPRQALLTSHEQQPEYDGLAAPANPRGSARSLLAARDSDTACFLR